MRLVYDNNRLKHLVTASAGHDAASFEILYKEFSGFVYGIANSVLRNVSDANDIVQEVFVKIYQLKECNLPGTNAVAWLYVLTKNEALGMIRKRRNECSITDYEDELASDHLYESMDENMIMHKVVSVLSEESREIVILKAVSGYTHKEISKILKIPQGTVQWKYHEAVKLMKKLYEEINNPNNTPRVKHLYGIGNKQDGQESFEP